MLAKGTIVVYRGKTALVVAEGEKAELRLRDGSSVRVRDKDVRVLHAGPATSLPAEAPPTEAPEDAWELASGQTMSVREFAELLYAEWTPQSACSAWALLAPDGLFREDGDRVRAASPDEARESREKARKKAEAAADREAFLAKAKAGRFGEEGVSPGDERYFQEIEALALGKSAKSSLLAELKRQETPEAAHAFLLKCGRWTDSVNPYPARAQCPLKAPDCPLDEEDASPRRDLTMLESLAIDNPWSDDPDDAISIDGDIVWVHVADPSIAVRAGSASDLAALERGQTLYLPEGAIPMLPDAALERYGLGLADRSPALSFAIRFDPSGAAFLADLTPSIVRVRRMTYPEADGLLASHPALRSLDGIATAREAFRAGNGAVDIAIPEVHVVVRDGEIALGAAEYWRSATIVRECMFAAGEACARWVFSLGAAFPFYGQEAPNDSGAEPDGIAGQFARRRRMKAGAYSTSPNAHRGAGLPFYAQVTSPLRRYIDLLAHRQLRLILRDGGFAEPRAAAAMGADDLLRPMAAAQAASAANRAAERASEAHWTIAWLGRHPGWEGEAIVIGQTPDGASAWLPALGLETRLKGVKAELNETIRVRLASVDVPLCSCSFERA